MLSVRVCTERHNVVLYISAVPTHERPDALARDEVATAMRCYTRRNVCLGPDMYACQGPGMEEVCIKIFLLTCYGFSTARRASRVDGIGRFCFCCSDGEVGVVSVMESSICMRWAGEARGW